MNTIILLFRQCIKSIDYITSVVMVKLMYFKQISRLESDRQTVWLWGGGGGFHMVTGWMG